MEFCVNKCLSSEEKHDSLSSVVPNDCIFIVSD